MSPLGILQMKCSLFRKIFMRIVIYRKGLKLHTCRMCNTLSMNRFSLLARAATQQVEDIRQCQTNNDHPCV